jgi:hypothetical protein
MALMMLFKRIYEKVRSWLTPCMSLRRVKGDLFPEKIPKRTMIMLDDDGPYAIGFSCPCGCGERIELTLMEGVSPRWDLITDEMNRPTLKPSIYKQSGCRSHFWIREGIIIWCD